jgi:hypothetical protein
LAHLGNGNDERLHPHGTFSSAGAGGWSALADLPPLKKIHHSYRISNFSAADPLHSDFVRITGACPLSLLDDNYWGKGMINECVTAAGRFGAVLSINHSPWYNHYSSKDKTLAPDCCPEKEAAELAWYRQRLAQTAIWIEQANARLGTNVTVGAVMLDAERWTSTRGKNQTWDAAMTRKHTLMFNATAELLPGVTLQWYDRGGYTYDGMGTGYFAPSPYFTLDEPGAMFSTSLYALGQVGYTREQVRVICAAPILTVFAAAAGTREQVAMLPVVLLLSILLLPGAADPVLVPTVRSHCGARQELQC